MQNRLLQMTLSGGIFGEHLLCQCEKTSMDILSTLNECMQQLYYLTGALITLYLLCAIEFCAYPVIVFTSTSTIVPLLPVNIPFVDIDTTDGYMITTVYHIVVLFVASLGLAFIDGLFFNLIFNVLTITKLQCNQFQILNEELEEAKPPIALIKIRLVNLFKMNQEMQR